MVLSVLFCRVARIEQTETPQMMEQRVRSSKFCFLDPLLLNLFSSVVTSPTRFDRVVCREVCALISRGMTELMGD